MRDGVICFLEGDVMVRRCWNSSDLFGRESQYWRNGRRLRNLGTNSDLRFCTSSPRNLLFARDAI